MTETAELFDTNIDFEEDKEERWKRYREIVAKLRLIDDDFMSQVLNDNLPAVKCILDIVLERDDLEVISAKTQVEYKSAASRSIKLDVRAEDADGNPVALTAAIDGEASAELMLVVGTDEGGLTHPDWQENLANALKVQALLNRSAPGLCRNLDLRT